MQAIQVGNTRGVLREIKMQTKGAEVNGFLFSCPKTKALLPTTEVKLAHCEAA